MGLPILSRRWTSRTCGIEFESGCMANFTASRVSTEQVRKCASFSRGSNVARLCAAGVLVFTVDDSGEPMGFDPFNPEKCRGQRVPGITPFKPKVEQQEPLKAEILQLPGCGAAALAARSDAGRWPQRTGDCHADRGSDCRTQ